MKQYLVFMTLVKMPSENIVGKGEIAGNQHFLLFLQCLPPYHHFSYNCCLHLLSFWISPKFNDLVKH